MEPSLAPRNVCWNPKLSRCSEHIPRWPARRLFQYWHNMICWKGCGSQGESKLNNWEQGRGRNLHEISSEEAKPENVPLEFAIFNFAYERTFIARITTLIERLERKSIGKTNSLCSFILFAFSGEFSHQQLQPFRSFLPASDTPETLPSPVIWLFPGNGFDSLPTSRSSRGV